MRRNTRTITRTLHIALELDGDIPLFEGDFDLSGNSRADTDMVVDHFAAALPRKVVTQAIAMPLELRLTRGVYDNGDLMYPENQGRLKIAEGDYASHKIIAIEATFREV